MQAYLKAKMEAEHASQQAALLAKLARLEAAAAAGSRALA